MWHKIKNMMGIDEGQYDYEEYSPEEEDMDVAGYADVYEPIQSHPREELRDKTTPMKQGDKMPKNNVIGMPGLANGLSEVMVIEPHSFDEMPQVIQALRERRSVVLNLNVMNPEEAQRAVDFIAGGTFAMDGHQERVGESIFLFTPSCVKVSTLSRIIRDVNEPPESRIRQVPSTSDPWSESTAIAQ